MLSKCWLGQNWPQFVVKTNTNVKDDDNLGRFKQNRNNISAVFDVNIYLREYLILFKNECEGFDFERNDLTDVFHRNKKKNV